MTPPCYEASLPGITTSRGLSYLYSSDDLRLEATTEGESTDCPAGKSRSRGPNSMFAHFTHTVRPCLLAHCGFFLYRWYAHCAHTVAHSRNHLPSSSMKITPLERTRQHTAHPQEDGTSEMQCSLYCTPPLYVIWAILQMAATIGLAASSCKCCK